MINDNKTEFLLIGTRQQVAKINTVWSITVGEYGIDPSLCDLLEISACGLIVS